MTSSNPVLSRLAETHFPHAWSFFASWDHQHVPKTPITTPINGLTADQRSEICAILASDSLRAELFVQRQKIFGLVNPFTMVVARLGTENLDVHLKEPRNKDDNFVVRGLSESHVLGYYELKVLAERAWKSKDRYEEMSLIDLEAETRSERRQQILEILSCRALQSSFELLLPYPITFRYRAPHRIAAASKISSIMLLQRFSSQEAQIAALQAR